LPPQAYIYRPSSFRALAVSTGLAVSEIFLKNKIKINFKKNKENKF
jgi:hypothetical protein